MWMEKQLSGFKGAGGGKGGDNKIGKLVVGLGGTKEFYNLVVVTGLYLFVQDL